MTTITEPYTLTSRPDLNMAHIRHRNGSALLCSGAAATDWQTVEAGQKPLCKRCVENLEDREYRSRWIREGGQSGMGRGRA